VDHQVRLDHRVHEAQWDRLVFHHNPDYRDLQVVQACPDQEDEQVKLHEYCAMYFSLDKDLNDVVRWLRMRGEKTVNNDNLAMSSVSAG